MGNKVYLLDSNIVIKMWRESPNCFEDIKKEGRFNFRISHNVAGELSKKEFKDFNGVPILTEKFIELLDYILSEDECKIVGGYKPFYSIDGNKISRNDYELICICQNNESYILVTEDKRLFHSAITILGPSKVLNYEEFIETIGGQL